MTNLRIRAYNVGQGEALLVSVPDRAHTGEARLRHIFIDGGSGLDGTEEISQDDLLTAVLGDVLAVLDGRPLDLYVMTHAHLDHVQGLFYAAQKLGLELPVRCAWLPASAAPDYHTENAQAGEKWAALCSVYEEIGDYTRALQAAEEEVPPAVQALLLNNNIFGAAGARPPDSVKTADCIAYLRTLAREKTCYVHRETEALEQTHPFQEARLEIWAPEADMSVYYGRVQPMALSVAPAKRRHAQPRLRHLVPPPGVDTSAFYHLVESRRSGYVANLLAIDQAVNNGSIVFALEWRGRRLLFPGDPQIRSWQTMAGFARLQPVDFIKLSHQGSGYGTPAGALLDKILPVEPGDGRERIALIAASPGQAGAETTARLSARGVIVRSVYEESEGGGYVDVEYLD